MKSALLIIMCCSFASSVAAARVKRLSHGAMKTESEFEPAEPWYAVSDTSMPGSLLESNSTMKCDLDRYKPVLEPRFKDFKYAGSGASGCVVLAYDTKISKTVAIKTKKTPGGLQGWKAECADAQALHMAACKKSKEAFQLAEKYLPSCLEAGGTEEAPYIVMHAAGGDGLGHTKLPESTKASVFAQLVGALTAMHGIGYAHCDLSKENIIILTGTTQLVLIDFGSARTLWKARGKLKQGGYKQDENVLAFYASDLAECPKEAWFAYLPGREIKTSADKQAAQKSALLSCLQKKWDVDQEFLDMFGKVIDEAYNRQTPTLVPELYHTKWVQTKEAGRESLFPTGNCAAYSSP